MRHGSRRRGGGRSNRCFDSKLTSEKSLALKAVAPLHVVVAPHAVVATSGAWRYAAACTATRRQGASVLSSYSILARTAATDTHALSFFFGLKAVREGWLSLVRVCSCFSTMHNETTTSKLLAMPAASCNTACSLLAQYTKSSKAAAIAVCWGKCCRSYAAAAAARTARLDVAASFASYFLPSPPTRLPPPERHAAAPHSASAQCLLAVLRVTTNSVVLYFYSTVVGFYVRLPPPSSSSPLFCF